MVILVFYVSWRAQATDETFNHWFAMRDLTPLSSFDDWRPGDVCVLNNGIPERVMRAEQFKLPQPRKPRPEDHIRLRFEVDQSSEAKSALPPSILTVAAKAGSTAIIDVSMQGFSIFANELGDLGKALYANESLVDYASKHPNDLFVVQAAAHVEAVNLNVESESSGSAEISTRVERVPRISSGLKRGSGTTRETHL